jgi:hypothetical protein
VRGVGQRRASGGSQCHLVRITRVTLSQTFWLFQTYLHDLAYAPNSNAFKTCRRIYNRVQRIVFGSAEPQRRERIKENVLPTTVLSSLVLASIAAPFLPAHAGPLAIAQARKPRPLEDMISDNVQTGKVGRSNTVAGGSPRPRQRRTDQGHSDPEDGRASKAPAPRPRDPRDPKDLRRQAARPPHAARGASAQHRPSLLNIDAEARLSSSSLPDFRNARTRYPLPRLQLAWGRRLTGLLASTRRSSNRHDLSRQQHLRAHRKYDY